LDEYISKSMIKSIVPLELQHTGIQYFIDQAKANFDRNKELSKILEKIQEKCSAIQLMKSSNWGVKSYGIFEASVSCHKYIIKTRPT
jgi:hypothetical protein